MKGHTLVKDGSGQRWCPDAEYNSNPGRFKVVEVAKPKAKAKAAPKKEAPNG